MRRKMLVGNWKMNGSSHDNAPLSASIDAELGKLNDIVVGLCVPFVYLPQIVNGLADSQVLVGAQDVSVHPSGAYTGEISATMLADVGCELVIVGHSERRQYHHESDLLIGQKALAALKAGLTPIVCLGESLTQRESGETLDIIGQQLKAVQSVLSNDFMEKIIVAYEPVWAIGTGLTASPEQAQEVHAFIRKKLGAVGEKIALLYGGSVKAENAEMLFAQHDIDGALVGGASLKSSEFVQIAKAF